METRFEMRIACGSMVNPMLQAIIVRMAPSREIPVGKIHYGRFIAVLQILKNHQSLISSQILVSVNILLLFAFKKRELYINKEAFEFEICTALKQHKYKVKNSTMKFVFLTTYTSLSKQAIWCELTNCFVPYIFGKGKTAKISLKISAVQKLATATFGRVQL